MIFPIGDYPNPRIRPWVTWGLIAVNVAVFVLVTLPLSRVAPDRSDPALYEYVRFLAQIGERREAVSAYDLVVFTRGFRPADPSLLDVLTSMFLHGGLAHLLGNMLFLWIYGDNVEARLGRVRYLLAYLGTGVAATLANWAVAPGSPLPMVGASGAISGVLGFYFLWFPANRVILMLFLFPLFADRIAVPARLVLGMYLLVDNLLPFLLTDPAAGGVAHGAHIGGFLAGLALAWKGRQRGDGGPRRMPPGVEYIPPGQAPFGDSPRTPRPPRPPPW